MVAWDSESRQNGYSRDGNGKHFPVSAKGDFSWDLGYNLTAGDDSLYSFLLSSSVMRAHNSLQSGQILIGYARDEDIKALFELLGMISRASPPVTPAQINEIERFISSQVPQTRRDYAISCFRAGKEVTIVKGAITTRAFQLYGYQGEGAVERWLEPIQVLDILLKVALSDGDFVLDEDYVVDSVRATLAVHNRSYWTLRDTLAERMGVYIRRDGESFAKLESTSSQESSKPKRAISETTRKASLELFGLSDEASQDEIKSRHRSLVKKFHPDLQSKTISDEELKEKMNLFCEIQEAYEVLTS